MRTLSMSEHQDHIHPKWGVEQVGWLGQTGAVYRLDDDPSRTEPGGFGPLYQPRDESCGHALIDENTSDGSHSFKELYEYRLLYNAALFNEWATLALERRAQWAVNADIHKSRRHSDGEPAFGGGWFVVVAQLPTGQISNHYPEEAWGLFRIPERETAVEWDGHTHTDAAARLRKFLTPN